MTVTVKISGILQDGTGRPVVDCTIVLKALVTTEEVIVKTTGYGDVDPAGWYSIEVLPGRYDITLWMERRPPACVGTITVYADSPPGTLNHFLLTPGVETLTPEILRQFADIATHVGVLAEKAGDEVTRAEVMVSKARKLVKVPDEPGCFEMTRDGWLKRERFDVEVAEAKAPGNTLDVSSHQCFIIDGTKSASVTFTGLPEGRAVMLVLIVRGSGGNLLWPEDLQWSWAIPPSLGKTRTIIPVIWDGEGLYGGAPVVI
ncbi:hypothetical protein H9V85_001592 [Salmonella enterica subsp. enterica serovar Louisiana]|nr:hypothetical protein [Salmonella enterica subsp. enterica serovar Louisiana]ECA5248519.1 hypothetical protein [Salmonella enterica subsp. enterica serovar Lomalinda]ECD3926758.1 hypothetical protein [Salmonella enterica subsp. enterica serovar Wangata]EDV1504999.1 hypothetical protein [Salmonella enterica subsp. salamae]EEI9681225.1 hypothetical protein [Salmonella enterica]